MIDQTMSNGYPVTDFLNQEEIQWFYSPEFITDEKENGPDSLKFRALSDTISKKTDRWLMKNLTSEWIREFSGLTGGKAGGGIPVEELKARENDFIRIIDSTDISFDSLWNAGSVFKDLFGEENATKYKTEADSAMSLAFEKILISFKDYTVRIAMPGKLIGTNGFMDSTKVTLWPVSDDYFLTQPYEMWAESKAPNIWAWIVTGIFLVFVLAGIIFRAIKKG
jgi:hypothetical protein